MIKNWKYKKLYRLRYYLADLPFQRIRNFKRSKWKKFQTFFRKIVFRKPKKVSFVLPTKERFKRFKSYDVAQPSFVERLKRFKCYNMTQTNVSKRFIGRHRFAYQNGLNLRNSISESYGNSFSLKEFKQDCRSIEHEQAVYMIKPWYKLEVFLFKLKILPSINECRKAILDKKILVNNQPRHYSYILKGLDVINCLFSTSIKKTCKFKRKNFLKSFVEFDYQTNTIVLLKEWNDLSMMDLSFALREYKTLQEFKFYLRRH